MLRGTFVTGQPRASVEREVGPCNLPGSLHGGYLRNPWAYDSTEVRRLRNDKRDVSILVSIVDLRRKYSVSYSTLI